MDRLRLYQFKDVVERVLDIGPIIGVGSDGMVRKLSKESRKLFNEVYKPLLVKVDELIEKDSTNRTKIMKDVFPDAFKTHNTPTEPTPFEQGTGKTCALIQFRRYLEE